MFSEAYYPLQFPLILQEPMILYQEQSEESGTWSQVKYLELQVPSKWDMSGEIVDHRSFFLFNWDIFQHYDQVDQKGVLRDSQQSQVFVGGQPDGMQSKYNMISNKQKPLFISTDYTHRAEILLTYSTDLHYCAKFDYLAKKPYVLKPPPNVNVKDYRFIFFKRYTEKEELLLDVVGFSKREKKLDLILAFLMKNLVYEVRYSKEGIKKQVEDAVDRIFMKVLKNVFRFIGQVLFVNTYRKLFELTYNILVKKSNEFDQILTLREPHPLFCNNLNILKRDIKSIVYKVMITEGLFPINCETNTMDDSYIKLKLLNMIVDQEVLPWSPKFHASLSLSNFHYSFTPNDLFNLRTLKQRKYHKRYKYISMRVLDFFPLDGWVQQISEFFEQNLCDMLAYIREYMGSEVRRHHESEDEEKQPNLKMSGLRDPLIRPVEVALTHSVRSASHSHITNKSHSQQTVTILLIILFKETELINDQQRSGTLQGYASNLIGIITTKQSKQSIMLATEFRPRELIYETAVFDPLPENKEKNKKQLQHFKNILKRALRRVTNKTNIYDIIIETPLIQKIKTNVAEEFQQTYRYELEVTGILNQFCQIITETEMRSYSTLVNNCQTPVAAFIYMLCDTFRPYSESLNRQIHFLQQCKDHGFHLDISQDVNNRSKTHGLSDLEPTKFTKQNSVMNTDLIYSYRPLASNMVLSNIASLTGMNTINVEFESKLMHFGKFNSTCNLISQGIQFIQPIILNRALDYFGFYGDQLSADYLQKMQSIDADPSLYQSPHQPNKGFFRRISQSKETKSNVPFEQEHWFATQIQKSQGHFFQNYELIMQSYRIQGDHSQSSVTQEINYLMSTIDEPQLFNMTSSKQVKTSNVFNIIKKSQIESENSMELDMHYLMIHYQNKLIKLKQDGEGNAAEKHYIQELYSEACFIYYNSVRLQLAQKVRKNTLSYIGFLLAKDPDSTYKDIPENVTLQTLV